MGRTMVEVGDGDLTVTMTNFSPFKQRISEDWVIGTIEQARGVDTREEEYIHMLGEGTEKGKAIPRSKFKEQINPGIKEEEKEQLTDMLMSHQECFAKTTKELGHCDMAEHEIDVGDAKPIHQSPYKRAWNERVIIKEQVGDMLEQKIIKPSNSPWASLVILVRRMAILH